MINVDNLREIKGNEVRGSVVQLLSELEYVFSLFYIQGILKEGYSKEILDKAIDSAKNHGSRRALEAMRDLKYKD